MGPTTHSFPPRSGARPLVGPTTADGRPGLGGKFTLEIAFDHEYVGEGTQAVGAWAYRVSGPAPLGDQGWTHAPDASTAFVHGLLRLTFIQGDRPGAPQMFAPVQQPFGKGIAAVLDGEEPPCLKE